MRTHLPPKKYQPNKTILSWIKKQKGNIKIFENPKKAIKNADVVFADKFISLNNKVNKKKKLNDFKRFQVNSKLMNLAKKNVIFLHCLPASRGDEVTSEIIDGKKSVGKIIPMSIDLEKSGLGNKSKPAVKPIIIDM